MDCSTENVDPFTFKFFYLRLDDSGRFARDAQLFEDFTDFFTALEQFWYNKDRKSLLYAGGFKGDLDDLAVDFAYGDNKENGFPVASHQMSEAAEFFDSEEGELLPFTVIGVWNTGDGFRRSVEFTKAKSFKHAEFLQRAAREGVGEYLVAGVVAGHHFSLDDADYLYATKTGHAVDDDAEKESRSVEEAAFAASYGKKPFYKKLFSN